MEKPSVTSYHINIGTGDSAIHVLENQTTGKDPKGYLHAVLVDGGLQAASTVLKSAIELISKNYLKDGVIKFDAIVVTHWDTDHYQGIVKLLQDDFRDQLKANDKLDKKTLRSTYMKYDKDDCLTTFYAPYWGNTDAKGIKGPFKGLGCNDKGPIALLNIELNAKDSVLGVCKLCYCAEGDNGYLGRELFTTSVCGQGPFTSPLALREAYNLLNGAEKSLPGLFCIGGDEKEILKGGTPESGSFGGAAAGHLGRAAPMMGSGFGVIDKRDTPSNRSSMVCVILDPAGIPLHYFSGDADWETDKSLSGWVKLGRNKGWGIPVMKLSHHGGTGNNPISMFDNLQPSCVIISAGDKHKHPTGATIVYLRAFQRKYRNDMSQFVYATRKPYWFDTEDQSYWTAGDKFKPAIEKTSPGFWDEIFDKLKKTELRIEELSEKITNLKGETPKTDKEKKEKEKRLGKMNQKLKVAKESKAAAEQGMGSVVKQKCEKYWKDLSPIRNPGLGCKVTTKGVAGGESIDDGKYITTISRDNILYLRVKWTSTTGVGIYYATKWNDKERVVPLTKAEVVVAHIQAPEGIYSPAPGPSRESITSESITAMEVDGGDGSSDAVDGDDSDSVAGDDMEMVSGDGGMMSAPSDPVSTADTRAIPSPLIARTSSRPEPVRRRTTTAAHTYDISSRPIAREPDLAIPPHEFFCIASDFSLDTVASSDAQYYAPLTLSSLDKFLKFLDNGKIGLTTCPVSGPKTSLLENDPIFSWFKGPELGATEVYVIGTGISSGKVGISAFGGVFSFGSSTGWKLPFSTDSNNNVFGVSIVPPIGLTVGSSMLIMSLDSSIVEKETTTLRAVAKAFSSHFRFVATEADDFELELDTSAKRNAIWFSPAARNETFVRLVFTTTTKSLSLLQKFLQRHISEITIDESPKLTVKKKITNIGSNQDGKFVTHMDPQLTIESTINIGEFAFNTVLVFNLGYIEIRIQWNKDENLSLDDIFNLVENNFVSIGKLDSKKPEITSYSEKWTDKIKLREIVLIVNKSGVASFNIDFEAPASFLNPDTSDTQVSFLLGYHYPGNVFKAELLMATSSSRAEEKFGIIPEYEKYLDLRPADGKTLATTVPLSKLIPGDIGTPPQGIGLDVYMVEFELSPNYISFTGGIRCDVERFRNAEGNVPPVVTSTLSLYANYSFADKELDLKLETRIALQPKKGAINAAGKPFTPAVLLGSFEYSNKEWTLSVSAESLNFAALYSLMDPDFNDSMMNLLAEIEIRSLDVKYQYTDGGPSSFQCSGLLLLGSLEFELDYKYGDNSGGKDWTFEAKIGSKSPESSVKEMIMGVCPDLAAMIPDFVDIPLLPLGGSSSDGLMITHDQNTLIFKLEVRIGTNETLTFLQLQQQATEGGELPSPKRVLYFSMGELPVLDEIPLVGKISKQLVDELDFVWVHADKSSGGLTEAELLKLNEIMKDRPLRYKAPEDSTADALITTGFHFMVVDGGVVKLDYHFGQNNDSDSKHYSGGALPPPSGGSDSGDPVTTPMVKNIGPLSISNIGIELKGKVISLKLDAKCLLGPIEFELLGFSIGFDFSTAKLNQLSTLKPIFSISGLGASVDEPPLDLAGIFEKKGDTYFGGCILGLTPYSLMAVGSYGVIHVDAQGKVTTPPTNPPVGGSSFHSAFVFATLDGPLAELEFAEITGVKFGFGYNSRLVNPTIDNIFQFPLISSAEMDASDPLALMNKYFCGEAWVVNQKDTFWFAAGFTVLAFELLKVSVVAVIEFNPKLEIILLADAVASMPKLSDDPSKSFVFVELGIMATMDFENCAVQIDGQLSPNSFILLPTCNLSGGFALYYWFGDSPYAGDWVCSVGGYHVSYKPPSYYPKPKRLAIAFHVDDHLSINGDAYFALTPKVCMGGGHLSAVFTLNGLVAYFDAWADFLINFKPFYFSGDIGVVVGITYTVNLWLTTIPISLHLSASFDIQGPPFSGVLHVDFYLFGFSCHFGDKCSIPKALTPKEFMDMLSHPPSGEQSGPQIQLSVISGLVPSKSGNNDKDITPWQVRAGTFTFAVQSKFPFTGMQYGVSGETTKFNTEIYAKPMHISDPVKSTITITVVNTTTGTEIPGFIIKEGYERLPSSVWGAYSDSDDPSTHGNSLPALLSGDSPTVCLATRVTVSPPSAHICGKDIPAFPAQAPESVRDDTYTPSTPADQTIFRPLPGQHTYEDIQEAWGGGNLPKLAKAWEGAFGWDLSEESELPLVTIKKMKEVYMAAPMLTT
ncbi:hypothetical protein Q9L58_009635 [Maublancomyces gigas]|uniref:DUF6603 domain-containing protein n=1 Tax=Discina gigas TaxID=1032678 RepID=A0ABR3G6B1_9PEZI